MSGQRLQLREGVTRGWVYEHIGRPGPARALPVQVLIDGDGAMVIEPDGDWTDVTVVDDQGGAS